MGCGVKEKGSKGIGLTREGGEEGRLVWRGALTTTGMKASMSAMGPCFISAAG